MTEATQKLATSTKDIRPLYDHGLPFSAWTVETLDSLKQRVKNNKACAIVLDGPMGEGKTTLGVHLADYIQGDFIDLKEQIGMGGQDFRSKFLDSKKGKIKVCIYDEAGDFRKHGAITKFNREMSRFFETYRAFKIIVIMILPNFNMLDKMLFENQVVRCLFHCHSRTNRSGSYDVHDFENMMWLRHYMSKEVIPSKSYKYVTPNARGHFLDISKERSKQLDRLSTEAKKEENEKGLVRMEGLISIKNIATKVGKSPQWVRQAINDKGLNEIKKMGHTKLYSDNVPDILLDWDRNKIDRRLKRKQAGHKD